jgi:HlyD family secretion protein
MSGCGGDDTADAYGNFQATEITVSTEAQGPLIRFTAQEGDRLRAGQVVGLVDTTQLSLQRRAVRSQQQSLTAQRQATLAQLPEIAAQVDALRAQLETAEEELDRTRRLYEGQAATARELNQREGEVAVLRKQVEQARARVNTIREQAASIAAQVSQTASQAAEIEERLRDARIVNPVAGTILSVVAERGEIVQNGAPLYTIADLDTLELRAYATGNQLPRLTIGMDVAVVVDGENQELRTLDGEVVWIAADAQFTPTPIQTRDNRAELVYAFDVRVPNPNGLLKVGMPGEVRFPAPSAESGRPSGDDNALPDPATRRNDA